jgi:glycine/D-amino acid oxidase-like deaminating enzyme
VIGAGVIGAAIACHLAKAGHGVTVIDKTGPAAGASGRSFGWINASFFADADHFRLRAAGIEAWRRAGMQDVTWSASLWFEEEGPGFDAMVQQLRALDYPAEVVDRAAFATLEPGVGAPPERALRLPSEGAAEVGAVTHGYLARAQSFGARALYGVEVSGIDTRQGAVRAVLTSAGAVPADQVVIAAGTGVPGLTEPLGVMVPMLRRPGLLITTRPVAPVLSHILIAPGQELRQLPDGRFLAPTSPNHQGDETSELGAPAGELAEAALARMAQLVPDQALALESTTLAFRPVPEDGLPVVGPAGPDGLYIATMHSGVTLAAIIGELVAEELTHGGKADLLAPYRPQRFANSDQAA